MLNYLKRGVVDGRQPFGEFGPRPGFHPRNEEAKNIVKHFDLLVAQPLAIVQKEIGHSPERGDAFGGGPARYGILKFGND